MTFCTSNRQWRQREFGSASGAGSSRASRCRHNFKRVEDLALDVIADALRRTTAQSYIQHYEDVLSQLRSRRQKGPAPVGEARRQRAGAAPIKSATKPQPLKKAPAKKKPATKKKLAAKKR